MPFRSFYFGPDRSLKRDLSVEEIAAAARSRDGVLWVDIYETSEADGKFLADTFGFHPVVIEDCVSPDIHPPKVEDFRDYIFLILHGIDYMETSELVQTTELSLFLGPRYIVSNHNDQMYSVEAVVQRVTADPSVMDRGADFIAHLLVDALVDNVMPSVDRLTEVADQLDAAALRSPDPAVLELVRNLKRSTMRIHRVMVPQRELLNRLGRREFHLLSEGVIVYFRDSYDQMVRIGDLLQIVRETADAAIANYMSALGARQNESMRRLSVLAAIFMPLSLLAGVYGMNFEYMPELGVRGAYFAVVGVMAAVIIGAVAWLGALRWMVASQRNLAKHLSLRVSPERLVGYTGRVLQVGRAPIQGIASTATLSARKASTKSGS